VVKRLLMVVALLAPAVAYGSDPGNDLSVPILPAASPAPPPSGGGPSPPTEAAKAGFTTLAANYDFSTSTYARQSNWLDWTGTNTNSNFLWHNSWPGGQSGCSAKFSPTIKQTTDGDNKVLDIKFPMSNYSLGQTGNCNFVAMSTVTYGCNQTSTPGQYSPCAGAQFPNMYVESVYRVDNGASNVANGIGPNGVWTWQSNYNGGSSLELDFGELYGTMSGPYASNGWHNWQAGGGNFFWCTYSTSCGGETGNTNLPGGYSPTAYHKYGMLLTSDGATAEYACSYIDDILQNCQNVGAVSPQFTNRNYLIAWNGNYPGGSEPTVNMYLQYVKVWSCANWNGSSSPANQCNSSTLYNSGGLTYWH
jgi:hypothetical protein